jgi:BON domain-containing protein
MNKQRLGLLGSAGLAAGLGAGLMYLLDPQAGGRRRALARDKAVHVMKKGGEAARKTSRHLGNRTRGLVAEAGSRLRREHPDDRKLRERVRAELGRAVSHPGAIEVTAQDGLVILSGPVLASELDQLLATVRSVRGVKDVENHLEVHETPDGVPALQGEGRAASRFGRGNKLAALGAVGLGLLAQSLSRKNGRHREHLGERGTGHRSELESAHHPLPL